MNLKFKYNIFLQVLKEEPMISTILHSHNDRSPK